MKKVIVITAFVLFGLSMSQAQTQKKSQEVKYGLKGGMNISNINATGGDSPNTTSFVNVHIGFFAEVKLNQKVSFQPELIYSFQGAKYDYLYDDGQNVYPTNNTLKFSYLNIPLMFKYYPENKFFLEAGPQIGILTAARVEVKIPGLGSDDANVKDSFKDLDLGLNFGLGYNFSKNVVGNVRYNFGLSNIADTQPGDNSKIMNRVIQISFGYIF